VSATAVVMVLAAPHALVKVIVVMLSGQHSVLHIVAFATPSCFSKDEERLGEGHCGHAFWSAFCLAHSCICHPKLLQQR